MRLNNLIINRYKSNPRSVMVVKNAGISFFFKGLGILIGFVIVPLYLHAIGQRQYGIILTITSISAFISFFDVGIGNGLRTKLGEAITKNDKILARQYVSTAYFYVGLLFTSVFILYSVLSSYIPWYKILNIGRNEIPKLNILILIIIALFSMRFIAQLIGNVLMANLKSGMNDSIQFVTNFSIFIICFILKKNNHLDFNSILIVMCGLPLIILIVYSIYLYNNQFTWLKPSTSYINHKIRKGLLTLGMKFFAIQIVSLIIFSTTNLLIAQLFSQNDVTTYNIAFKYYNITVMVFAILISPLWGAFTNAWYKKDKAWIIKNIKTYSLIVLIFLFINIIQMFSYNRFIYLWLKQNLQISILLAISFIVYNFIYCYNNIFSHFLASIGKVNQQLYAAIFGGIINIPFTIYLARNTHLGLSSILYANIICLIPSTIVTTYQTYILLKKPSEA